MNSPVESWASDLQALLGVSYFIFAFSLFWLCKMGHYTGVTLSLLPGLPHLLSCKFFGVRQLLQLHKGPLSVPACTDTVILVGATGDNPNTHNWERGLKTHTYLLHHKHNHNLIHFLKNLTPTHAYFPSYFPLAFLLFWGFAYSLFLWLLLTSLLNSSVGLCLAGSSFTAMRR